MQIGRRRWVRLLARKFLLGGCVAIGLLGILPASAAGYREKVLYDFCTRSGCADGAVPRGTLIADPSGNLYGTSSSGGAGGGAVFELQHNPVTNKWANTVLYEFCTHNGCADGASPEAGVIMDPRGNIYGTTTSGGAHNEGAVFKLSYNAATKKWAEVVLYSFCAAPGCADGDIPVGGLVMDGTRTLYGTTAGGGIGSAPVGTVFKLSYRSNAKKWDETVVHSFCSENKCSDGASPQAGLIIDGAGNLYGTTSLGGVHSSGAVFELYQDAVTNKWAETVLYSFCASKTPTCSDGGAPAGALTIDAAGNLFGTTALGGARKAGTAFKLSYDAATKIWTLATLNIFGNRASMRGGEPRSELTADSLGSFYGTTTIGGAGKVGTAFRLRFNHAANKWGLRPLYAFCSAANCIDGGQPGGGLVIDGAGNLYGTTRYGGTHGGGTVFELSPE